MNGPIAVLAGTPVDTRMGVAYLEERGLPGVPFPLSRGPREQTAFQHAPAADKRRQALAVLRGAMAQGCRRAFVYCNSLSAAVDFPGLAEETGMRIVTPLDVYRRLAPCYRALGVIAANAQLLTHSTNDRVMDRGQLVGVLVTLHFMGSVGQRREEHGLCGICGKQQSTALAVHYFCPVHSGLCAALLRYKVLCHVVCNLVLVNAQLCTMLAIPVGLRRAVSVPLHRVVIGVDLEQHTESVFSKPGMALV